jgi:hypothetical protein
MWASHLFTLIALLSAPAAFTSGQALIIVAWVAQTFLQLVLLPVIIVGQNLQAAAADKCSKDTFKDAEAILDEVHQVQRHLEAQDAELDRIIGPSWRSRAGSAEEEGSADWRGRSEAAELAPYP